MDMATAAQPGVFRFADAPGLMRLLLRNLALNVVTLGFYRFWARTHLRRHIWGRIEVAGDPLEYTGTGGELFKGFLIALAVLLPLFTLYGIAEAVLPQDEVSIAVRSALFYGVLGILFLVAVFRARRYRLSRTMWRGIRFGQDGSAGRYIVGSCLWALATALTLSLALPWWRMWEQRLLMNATLFGDRRFECDARGGPMFKYWLVVLVTLGLGYVWYRVREARHVAAHTRLGAASFASTMRARVVYGRGLLFALVFLPIAVGLWFGVSAGLFEEIALTGSINAVAWMLASTAVLAILFLVLQSLLIWPLFYIPIFRHVCATLAVDRLDVLADTAQSSLAVSTSGEGLADAFDVGFG